ncbi:hypothetical protein [Mesorhizobium sp. IMUNJ 23232]|uniref:hypothetical protein n=1 Tax=Mesorhizobium sp. IMUNJ 23232 TaxID=3376064 RepID=UPI00378A575B
MLNLARRLGLLDPPGQPHDRRPAVVLHGDAASVERAWPDVDALLRDRSDFRLILAVPRGDLEAVRRRFSHELVIEGPPDGRFADRFWRRWRVAKFLDAAAPEAVRRGWARDLGSPVESTRGKKIRRQSILEKLICVPEIGSVETLRTRLGTPETIVCLGNGPTSERPELITYRDATLFRVNWTWAARGVMTNPDAVFTADPDVPPRGSKAILVFPRSEGGRIVLCQHLFAGRRAKNGFVMLDRLEPAIADFGAREIPTNGALMIAVAAALQPRRLVIAGMDLYRHPEGRYPGAQAVNGYARGHSARCDLALIEGALAGYKGETVILSPNLRAALGR